MAVRCCQWSFGAVQVYIKGISADIIRDISERRISMKVTDVFSWLPADAISIGGLELLFEGQHNGTYEGAYTVSLDMPEQAGMDIRNSSAALAEEGKKTAFVLKHDTVIAVIGYRETIRE